MSVLYPETIRPFLYLSILSGIANPVFGQAQTSADTFTDKLLAMLLILFILSLISERISNFFKLKLSDTRSGTPKEKQVLYYMSFNNTAIKTNDEEEEKKREYRILKINLFFGAFTALIFRTDLFDIVANLDNVTAHIGWASYNGKGLWPLLYTITGCILTGAFLSFGSKFWHDSIDLVVQIKEYRRMLTKDGFSNLQNQFSDKSYDQQSTIISSAIRENYQVWRALYPNVTGCTGGFKTQNGQTIPTNAIVFSVSEKKAADRLHESEQIPKQIFYGGQWIPTDVVPSSVATLQHNIKHPGDIDIPTRIGSNISRENINDFGSIGLKVRKTFTDKPDEIYLLTCFHVAFFERINERELKTKGIIDVVETEDSIANKLTVPGFQYRMQQGLQARLEAFAKRGVFSQTMDAALIRIQDHQLENSTFFFGRSETVKANGFLMFSQIVKDMKVFCYGCVSGRSEGRVTNPSFENKEIEIQTRSGRFNHTFSLLVQTTRISVPGDSGGVVLTESGAVVGIIVAGDVGQGATGDLFSYIIPFHFIKNILGVTL